MGREPPVTITEVEQKLDRIKEEEASNDGSEEAATEQAIEDAKVTLQSLREELERSQKEVDSAVQVLRKAGYLR